MILAFDTYYFDNKAKTVGIAFREWGAVQPEQVYSETLEDIAEYEPGAFYKRELPCIVSLLKQVDFQTIELIIVDGFVYLDDQGRLGLGGRLYETLGQSIPVIGVAKTNFASIENNKRKLLRGQSGNPLYITAIGIDVDEAAAHINTMSGEYRIPALLKQLDGLTKA